MSGFRKRVREQLKRERDQRHNGAGRTVTLDDLKEVRKTLGAPETDHEIIKKLIEDSLGSKFEEGECICGCECGRSGYWVPQVTERNIGYTDKGCNVDQAVIAALKVTHEASMCPT